MIIASILAIALVFRLILINQSFWLDEAASLIISQQSLPQLLHSLQGDFHPPLYYLFLHFYLRLGIHTEWFLRLPNIVFSLVSIYFIYQLFNLLNLKPLFQFKLSSKKFLITPAHLTAFFLAINPLSVYYSQELRMYLPNLTFSLISWFFLLRFNQSKSRQTRNLITFTLISSLNLYTFYGAFFNLLAQFFYQILSHKKNFLLFLTSLIVIFLTFIPWLPSLITQLHGGDYLTSVLPGWSVLSGSLTAKSLLLIPLKMILGHIDLNATVFTSIVSFLSLAYFLLLGAYSFFQKKSRPFLFWLLVPLLVAVLYSFKSPILGYWRYLFLLPAFVSLIVLAIYKLPSSLRLLNIFIISLIFLLGNFVFWSTPQNQREQWRQATTLFSEFDNQASIAIYAFSDSFAPVRWYRPDFPSLPALTSLTSDPAQIDANLSQGLLGKTNVLYFHYLSALTDSTSIIPAWLDNAGYQLVKTYDYPGVGFISFYQSITP